MKVFRILLLLLFIVLSGTVIYYSLRQIRYQYRLEPRQVGNGTNVQCAIDIEEHGAREAKNKSELYLTTQDNTLFFETLFLDGSGNNDDARISVTQKNNKKILQVQFEDTDNILHNHISLYRVEGKCTNIDPGEYILEILTISGRKITSKEYQIK